MWNNFLISLEIMVRGMGGIFAAILIIVLFVWLMGKIGSGREQKN